VQNLHNSGEHGPGAYRRALTREGQAWRPDFFNGLLLALDFHLGCRQNAPPDIVPLALTRDPGPIAPKNCAEELRRRTAPR